MSAPMTATEIRDRRALYAAGLLNWKLIVRPLEEATGYVAVLSSPDYHPINKTGRLIAERGHDHDAAVTAAIVKATGQ